MSRYNRHILDAIGYYKFAQCEIKVDEKNWDGVCREYWCGRNTCYLPICMRKKTRAKRRQRQQIDGGIEGGYK